MNRTFTIIGRSALLLLGALAVTSTPATDAAAQSLQDCSTSQTSNPNAMLGIGDPTDDGYGYRLALYQFLNSTLLADVAYPANWAPAVTAFSDDTAFYQSPPVAYGVHSYQRAFGTVTPQTTTPIANPYIANCQTDWNTSSPGANILPADQRRLEQHFLQTRLYGGNISDQDVLNRFLLDPSVFLLSNIEDVANCNALIPKLKNYSQMTFFAQWDYPGNIFLNVPDQQLRRFSVYLALNLIQQDWAAWKGSVAGTYPASTATSPWSGSPWNEVFHHPGAPNANNYPGQFTTLVADDMGDRLTMMARTYEWIKSEQPTWLTSSLETAFQEGLARTAERLSRMNLVGGQINRWYQAVHGLAAVKSVLAGTSWQAASTTWHDLGIRKILNAYHPAGYFGDDEGRYDAGYNKHNLRHVIRTLENDPGTNTASASALLQHAQTMGNLEAHMVFTDRTGLHLSPSAMSVRTGGGVVYQSREVIAPTFALNYLVAHDYNVPFSYARVRDLDGIGPFDDVRAQKFVDARSTNANYYTELACRRHPNHDAFHWKLTPLPAHEQTEEHISGTYRQYARPRHEVENYDNSNGSLLRAFADTVHQNEATAYLPFELPGPHLSNFDDEFVFAKYGGQGIYAEGDPTNDYYDTYAPDYVQSAAGTPAAADYAVMFHLGPVGTGTQTCNGEDVARGYGGGQIAALWAPGGGVFSLTRRMGYNTSCDSWQTGEWSSLPIHAVTLLDASSRVASSARIAQPAVSTHFAALTFLGTLGDDFISQGAAALAGVPAVAAPSATATFMEVSGNFSDQRYTFDGALTHIATNVAYRRRFVVSESGIQVRTDIDAITPQQTLPDVIQAWETLPIWLGEGVTDLGYVETEIDLIIGGQSVGTIPPPSSSSMQQAYHNVEKIIVAREDGLMTITFDKPQTIAFSDDYGNYGTSTPSRNLMVDLTPSQISSSNEGNSTPQDEPLQQKTVIYTITFRT